jgi:hypothetical protein
MERSWWFILVLLLISITTYAQLSSGTIANNRFLQRVNPAIDRALADSGSSLDHPEIQRLARQMVDLGIWSNLLFWVHEGLLKDSISGSDQFVLKTYDITTNNIDFTPTRGKPKIENSVFKYTQTNDDILSISSVSISQGTHTYMWWLNRTTAETDRSFLASISNTTPVQLQHFDSSGVYSLQIAFPRTTTSGTWRTTNRECTLGTWHHIAITYNYASTANDPIIYINGSAVSITQITTPNGSFGNITTFVLGNTAGLPRSLNGYISDFRSYNNILTATQIDAIFQETKAKYGY